MVTWSRPLASYIMFQYLSPNMKWPLGYCLMGPDRGTPEKTLKKWFITLTSPPASQLPAWPQTANPQCLVILPRGIRNLRAIGECGLLSSSSLFCWMAPFISEIANLFPPRSSRFTTWLCEWADSFSFIAHGATPSRTIDWVERSILLFCIS